MADGSDQVVYVACCHLPLDLIILWFSFAGVRFQVVVLRPSWDSPFQYSGQSSGKCPQVYLGHAFSNEGDGVVRTDFHNFLIDDIPLIFLTNWILLYLRSFMLFIF